MSVNYERLSRAYEKLLQASAGEGRFVDAVDAIAAAFGGGGSVIFELNRRGAAIQSWTSSTLRVGDDDYSHHINAINPRMHFAMRHAPATVIYEARFIDERTIDRHEFYDWLEDHSSFRYFLGARVQDEADISLMHSVEFDRRHGHPDQETIRAFSRSSRMVGDAWRLAARYGPAVETGEARSWVPDHLPWAVFALSVTGEVLQMNVRARRLLEDGAVSLQDGALRARHRGADSRLGRSIRAALAGTTTEMLLNGEATEPPLVVQIVAVNPTRINAPLQAAAVVYVSSPQDQPWTGSVLTRVWDLSPSEQKLVNLLATGLALADAAEQLGITRNTARNQLQSLFEKTGTKKQHQLLARLRGTLDT